MPANYQFRTAGHIVAGEHSIRRLKDHVRTIVPKADRALIITQPSIVKLGAIGEVQAQLTEIGIQSDVCTAILPE
ncbi:alcohol dehydrogenase, partial [Bacillus sp. JR_15]